MSNITIQNNDTSVVELWNGVYKPVTLLDAATVTYPKGTVLGVITASGKFTRYVSDASNGSEIPKAVLTEPVDLTAATDKGVRVLISGQVKREQLKANAGGIAITDAEAEQLRDYSIIVLSAPDLSKLDNQ